MFEEESFILFPYAYRVCVSPTLNSKALWSLFVLTSNSWGHLIDK